MLLEVVFLKKIQNFKINKKILKKEKEKRKPKLNRVQVQVTELSQEDGKGIVGWDETSKYDKMLIILLPICLPCQNKSSYYSPFNICDLSELFWIYGSSYP